MKNTFRLLVVVVGVCLCCLYAAAGEPPKATTGPADASLVAEKELVAELKNCPQTETERADKLVELFKQAGLKDVKTQKFSVGEMKGRCNIIATLPGKGESIIIVGAHLDFVKKGKGVIDNWSGVAMMANLAQTLAGRENSHTFMFVGFDLEEKGLWGSRHFVENLKDEQLKRIRAMVNINSMGVSGLSVFTNGSADALEELAAKVARDNSVKLGSQQLRLTQSDAESFMAAEIPAVTFIGLAFRDLKLIHTKNDEFKRIRARRYIEQYRYIVTFLRTLDAHEGEISIKDKEASLVPPEIGMLPDMEAFEKDGGFIVDEVVPGGAEDKAGIKVGDEIVSIPSEKVKTAKLIFTYLLCINEGDKVTFKVKRGEKVIEVTVQY